MSLYGILSCHIAVEDAKLELQVIYSGIQESDRPLAMELWDTKCNQSNSRSLSQK